MRVFILLIAAAFATSDWACATSSGGDWELCRSNLRKTVFGTSTMPSRPPDAIFPGPNVLQNNQTGYRWTIYDPAHPHLSPHLNATVFLTLNSSCHAPANYDTGPISTGGYYRWPHWPHRRAKTLLLYHNGHETSSNATNYDGVVWYFNRLGFDVAEFDMPLIGFNAQGGITSSHSYFAPFEFLGVHVMRYFLEPVVLFTDYAVNVLGYKHIVMIGLSGGGWTTTVASALDPRIELSFPIAGSLPFSMYNKYYDSRDFEQEPQRPMYSVATYNDMYVLAGLAVNGTKRASMQILHEMDSCCWTAGGREGPIIQYNEQAQSYGANFRTVVTVGNIHEMNVREKVIVAAFADALSREKMFNLVETMVPFDELQ